MQKYKNFYISDDEAEAKSQKVIIDEPYYRNLPFEEHDIAMDIGACIGTFARLAAGNVKHVISYEPFPSSFSLLELNCKDLVNVTLIQAAVIGDFSKTTKLWLGSNSAIHATTKYRGREPIEVKAVNFAVELYSYTPSILKIDIEGGEYEFKELFDLPEFVKKIFIEVHLNRREWRGGMAQSLLTSLEEQGFTWLRAPRFTRANWTTNVVGVR